MARKASIWQNRKVKGDFVGNYVYEKSPKSRYFTLTRMADKLKKEYESPRAAVLLGWVKVR